MLCAIAGLRANTRLRDWMGAHSVRGRGGSEKRRALGRALHGLAALGAIALTGPWRDGAFGSLLLAPLLAAAWTVLGFAQYVLLRRKADALVGLQYFTIFFDAAAFAVFLCDAPAATGFLVPYLPFIAIPVGLRYGVRTFWFAWVGTWLVAPPLLYFGHPFWTAHVQIVLSLVFLALLPAVFFGPLLSQWRLRQQRASSENQLQALEAAMVAKSAFLARVSHQLRSPLQAIMSSLELMEAPSQQANRPRLAANISASAQRLSHELRDLLTIARAEAWQLHLEPSAFEAGTLLESVAAELAPLNESQGRRIVTLPPREPLFLVADSDKIVQVLANVARHISATVHPHTLTLAVLPFDEPRGTVSFVVEGESADTPPAAVQPAGEPQKDALNDSLSLTLVRTLAEFLGGSTAQAQTLPNGLRFNVHIPCERVREDEEGHAPPPAAKIMVVSQNSQACRQILVPLHQRGWLAECVSTLPEAANRLALREYALVCVDMDLPRHNARRLALGLKSSQGFNRDTPIMAFHARRQEKPAGNDWPFDAVLAGRITRAGLLDTISSLRPGRLPH